MVKVADFRIEHFGSFADTLTVELSPKMTIFVGENNSGKSAVLRSFEPHLRENPHRSPVEWRDGFLQQPVHSIRLHANGAEINAAWRQVGQIKWATNDTQDIAATRWQIKAVLQSPKLTFAMTRQAGRDFLPVDAPSHGAYSGAQLGMVHASLSAAGIDLDGPYGNTEDTFPNVLNKLWHEKVFFFQALRSSPGRVAYSHPTRLDANAGNLAVQLAGLQGDNGDLFEKLVGHLREIFSTVGNLSVSSSDGAFEVRVWPTRAKSTRELSFSLDDSGTGVAQAIAILLVAMTMTEAVLVVDEISSYLHPSAAKILLRILQVEYPSHQYVISTHSPEVLTAGRDAEIYWVRKSGYESTVSRIDVRDLRQLRQVTGQLGVSLTDVFAAEHIVWVEGETEQNCFQLLYEPPATGASVMFVAVIATDDFHSKKVRAELIFDIYQQLTTTAAPVVGSVAFGFDREGLKDSQVEDLQRQSKDKIKFLPRRNFESYLLHPSSIARVMAASVAHVKALDVPDTERQVVEHLVELGGLKDYFAPTEKVDLYDAEWLRQVDGAKLLKDVFAKVMESTLPYDKVLHSEAILRDLLAHEPDAVGGLRSYVAELVAVASHP